MLEASKHGPRIDSLAAMYRVAGLEPIGLEDLLTFEYFPSRDALEFRLRSSPTIEDFDPVSEASLLDDVVRRNYAEEGIKISFHRLIIDARKR